MKVVDGLRHTEKMRPKRRIFFQLFFSFFGISSLLLALSSFILFYQYERITAAEINQKSIEMLKQSQSVFVSIHHWMVATFIKLSTSPEGNILLHTAEPAPLALQHAIETIDELVALNPFMHSIYTFNSRENRFYSTVRGIEEPDRLSDSSLPDLMRRIDSSAIYRYIPRTIAATKKEESQAFLDSRRHPTEVFTFVVGDIDRGSGTVGSAIIVNLDIGRVRRFILDSNPGSEEMLWIFDSMGGIVSAPGAAVESGYAEEMRELFLSLDVAGEEETHLTRLRGEKILLTRVASPELGWIFVSSTPYPQIFGGLIHARNLSLTLFLLLSLLAALAILLLTRRFSRPLNGLITAVETLGEELQIQERQSGDGSVSRIELPIETVRRISARMREYRETDRKETANPLIRLFSAEQEAPLLDNLQLPAAAAILSIDHARELERNIGRVPVRSLLQNCVELIEDEQRAGGAFRRTLVISSSEILFLLEETYAENAVGIRERMVKALGIETTIGIGSYARSIEDLQDSLNEAQMALSYSFHRGRGKIIRFSPEMAASRAGSIDEEPVKQLLFAVRERNRVGAAAALETIIDESMNLDPHSIDMLRQLLLYYFLRELTDLEGGSSTAFLELKPAVEEIYDVESADELRSLLSTVTQRWIRLREESHESRHLQLCEQIKEYIQREFQDGNLSSESIADRIGLTTNYIRTIFKHTCGESIADQINRVRFEYCKEQLTSTNLSVKEIFIAAGISNYSYGATSFKKYAGSTALEYRNRHGKG